jgi:hypothetical protein
MAVSAQKRPWAPTFFENSMTRKAASASISRHRPHFRPDPAAVDAIIIDEWVWSAMDDIPFIIEAWLLSSELKKRKTLEPTSIALPAASAASITFADVMPLLPSAAGQSLWCITSTGLTSHQIAPVHAAVVDHVAVIRRWHENRAGRRPRDLPEGD